MVGEVGIRGAHLRGPAGDRNPRPGPDLLEEVAEARGIRVPVAPAVVAQTGDRRRVRRPRAARRLAGEARTGPERGQRGGGDRDESEHHLRRAVAAPSRPERCTGSVGTVSYELLGHGSTDAGWNRKPVA